MTGALLKDLFRKFPNPDLCRKDAANVLSNYNDLRPQKKKFVYNDGREEELVALTGTIPVLYKGTTYNTPVCIWLQKNHPFVPPLVYVTPAAKMVIRATKHVDQNGRVYLPFLHEWSHPRSDLAAMVQILCCVFAEQPPMYTPFQMPPPTRRPAPASYGYPFCQGGARGGLPIMGDVPFPTRASLPVFEDAMFQNYRHPDKCKADSWRAVLAYRRLFPERKKFVHDDGREVELVVLTGTIPVISEGVAYNIPVRIWLQESHPFVAPLVFVAPPATLAIEPNHKHVDKLSGKVYLPYLQEWKDSGSNLVALLQKMCTVFTEQAPVCSRPASFPEPALTPTVRADFRKTFNAMEYKM